MLYMVIETFRDGDAVPVYQRFRDQGRLMPEGLEYVGSWVVKDLRLGVLERPLRLTRGGSRTLC